VAEPFEVMLSSDELAALCDRLELPPPVALERGEAGADGVEPVLDRLAGGADDMRRALEVLSSPETLVRMERRDATSTARAAIGISRGVAAEHRPISDDVHRIALVPGEDVLGRILAVCGLEERPIHELASFTITPAQLLEAVELARRGNVRMARAVLGGPGPSDPSRGTFARALASDPVAAQVTVLTQRGDGRLEGTATTWLDGREAGLWRVPPLDVSDPGEPDGLDQRALYQTLLEVAPTSRAAIIDEITEGFPELRRA
jgi:hypothetical protein